MNTTYSAGVADPNASGEVVKTEWPNAMFAVSGFINVVSPSQVSFLKKRALPGHAILALILLSLLKIEK